MIDKELQKTNWENIPQQVSSVEFCSTVKVREGLRKYFAILSTINYTLLYMLNNCPYFYIYKHILIPFVSIASFEMFLDYDMLILHPYPNVI